MGMKTQLGLEEYAHALFVVHDGQTPGSVYEDPADAIAEAEELAHAEGATWYVASMSIDDDFVHIARPPKAQPKKAKKKVRA